MPGNRFQLFLEVRVQPHLDTGDGASPVAGDHHAGLGFANLVFHAHQDGVGADLPSKGDAGLP